MSRGAIFAAICVCALSLSFWCGYRCAVCRQLPEPARDTVEVVRIDTVRIAQPVSVVRRVTDTLLVAITDTVTKADTVYMQLPFEALEYRDSTYRAIVSGYRPRLDEIEIYPRERTVTVTQRVEVPVRQRWGLGLTAGYGATAVGGSVQLAPYIGIGVQYSIISW